MSDWEDINTAANLWRWAPDNKPAPGLFDPGDGVCDYMSARLVLTASVVPEDLELSVEPQSSSPIVFLAIREAMAPVTDDNLAAIPLNPKQIRELIRFLMPFAEEP